MTNIKDAGNNLIALFDRGKKNAKFKWRCYSPEALVPEQTAYDTAKKSPSYYTREALAKIYLTGIPVVTKRTHCAFCDASTTFIYVNSNHSQPKISITISYNLLNSCQTCGI